MAEGTTWVYIAWKMGKLISITQANPSLTFLPHFGVFNLHLCNAFVGSNKYKKNVVKVGKIVGLKMCACIF